MRVSDHRGSPSVFSSQYLCFLPESMALFLRSSPDRFSSVQSTHIRMVIFGYYLVSRLVNYLLLVLFKVAGYVNPTASL